MTAATERLPGTVEIERQLAAQVWRIDRPDKWGAPESAYGTASDVDGNRPRHEGEIVDRGCLSPCQSRRIYSLRDQAREQRDARLQAGRQATLVLFRVLLGGPGEALESGDRNLGNSGGDGEQVQPGRHPLEPEVRPPPDKHVATGPLLPPRLAPIGRQLPGQSSQVPLRRSLRTIRWRAHGIPR